MNLQSITKNLLFILFLFSFFCANNAYAEYLLFKIGNKASYTITQKLALEYEIFNKKTYSQSEATIDIDIEILSSNPETSDYPYDVEVTLKRILISEIQQDNKRTTSISYDSESSKKIDNNILATHLDKLINHPLVFRVEKDFQIIETTGHLKQIYENFDSPSQMGLFGTTPWTFELLLTQLFHLSGKNLLTTNLYPVSCYQLLNWEDEALDEQEINLSQSSAYIVNAIDSKKIEANWEGNAQVKSIDGDMNGEVSVTGNVIWDISNPLIQHRNLEIKLEETYNGWFPVHIKMSAQQTWQPASL